MELGKLADKLKGVLAKYKYVAIVLLVGLGLMLMPKINKEEVNTTKAEPPQEEKSLEESLSVTLSRMSGAGKVEVILNIDQGAMTVYQMDEDTSKNESGYTDRSQTVTVSDSQRNQVGLVKQVNPPVYLGAVVLCQGADNPVVKLAIVEAVSKITGLSVNSICVLKMD